MSVLLDVLGWIGAGELLLAYGLVSTGRLPGNGLPFQLMNLTGAALLAVNTAYHRAWPSAALNLVWIAIGLATLAHARRTDRRESAVASTRQVRDS